MSKYKATLRDLFANPVKADIRWADIESLFGHFGGTVSEGSGSRVRVLLNGVVGLFHRPHPSPHTDKGAVKSVRNFLKSAGVKP